MRAELIGDRSHYRLQIFGRASRRDSIMAYFFKDSRVCACAKWNR